MAENICTRSLGAIADDIEAVVHEKLKIPFAWEYKADNTPVSNIDLAIQAGIISIIRKNFTSDNIVCEEAEQERVKTGAIYTWVIDPIDGTDNFINNKKEFSISVGLMEEDGFVEALLLFPKLKEKYYAKRGAGIWMNNSPYSIPEDKSVEKEIILCSKTHFSLKPFFEQAGYRVSFYKCATYSLLMLLKGDALFYLTINTMLYDVGPMSLILKEQGINIFNAKKEVLEFSAHTLSIPFFIALADARQLNIVFSIIESGINIII